MDDSTALALPGAVRWPPADLAAEPDSPFDLATFFSPVPKSENAAPLYLDALSDFDLGMAACFPEDQWAAVHERALRRQEKLAQIFDPATGQAAVWVNADTIDRVLDAYKVGFEKLRRAQERPRCAFELGPTASAELPHAFAARQVVTIARLRHNRDVQRGNLVRPIETVGIILRLARDLQPRASLMCQIVAVALELNSRELVLEILRLPDLRVDHVDLLLGVLERHELDALPHPLAEGHSVEYVYARTGLRDLEHRTGDYSPEGFRRLGPGFGSEIKTLGEFAVRCGKLLVGTNPNSGPERTAEEIDRQLNGMGPDDFKREAQHIKEYYEKLIAVSKRPFQNQVANFPKPLGFYLNLPGASPPYPLIWTRPLAGLRLVRCLAAMRRWQLTETTAPPNLETVVRAAGLNAVPDDPFGDRPIRMAWVANEPVVYSVGADGRDDGGQIDWNNGEQPGDFVLRLLPMPQPAAASPPPASTPQMQVVQVPVASSPPPKPSPGSFKLFRIAGTDVYIHWSWFLVAFILIRDRPVHYSSFAWDVVGYVGGFVLVLLHEFGHVLACRQVGGTADRVLLWPLGGLAFVVPPPRPGAHFWTTVAGPLVNLIFAPVLIGLAWVSMPTETPVANPDFFYLMRELAVFNSVMLVFNVLPIFPLDGGQILFAILWRWIGRSRGLEIASGIGFVCGVGLGVVAILFAQWWLLATAVFLCYGALTGLRTARKLAPLDRAPRRAEYACPACGSHPPVGPFWNCSQCGTATDVFDPLQVCPTCRMVFLAVACVECGQQRFGGEWVLPYSIVAD